MKVQKENVTVCVLFWLLLVSAAMAHKGFPDDLAQDLNVSVPEKIVEVKYPAKAVQVGPNVGHHATQAAVLVSRCIMRMAWFCKFRMCVFYARLGFVA